MLLSLYSTDNKLFSNAFIFFILLIPLISNGQKKDSSRYCLRIHPLQLLVRDLVLEGEVPLSSRFSLALNVGYRFPTFSNPEKVNTILHGANSGLEDQLMFIPYAQAFRVGLVPKMYTNKARNGFIAFETFFRYWWIDNKLFTLESGESIPPKPYYHSVFMNVLGFKFLAGANLRQWKINEKLKLDLSMFAGFGYRFRYEKQWDYTSKKPFTNTSGPFFNGKLINEFSPSFHCGLLFGLVNR